ncbi:hypothetical protein HZA38_01515 [Candidatus Peregrinibacteria bacterium]|nr:hypothetical protein [Candidatus Peregrinibacteria bacterium]
MYEFLASYYYYIHIICGLFAAAIAGLRGYNKMLWYSVIGPLLGPLALILAFFLPDIS